MLRRHRHARRWRLGEVQAEGKRRMPAADWIRGSAAGPAARWLLTDMSQRAARAARPAAASSGRAAGSAAAAIRHRRRSGPARRARRAAAPWPTGTPTPTCCCRQLLAQRELTGRDAALATELVYGTLRGQGSYDAVLGICCDRDLDSLDPVVREVLRLGTHQLLGTDPAARGRGHIGEPGQGQRPASGLPAS